MSTPTELETAARSYLRAARLLNRKSSDSPDAAAYLCGYAIELALKARICRTLHWPEYRVTKEFASFKTHQLNILLTLSGIEGRLKADPSLFTDWSIVQSWSPEQRYEPIGSKSSQNAKEAIDATGRLLGALL